MLIDVESFESLVPDFCCCDRLARELADDGVPIVYHARHRAFGIVYLGTAAVDSISFCPFCGMALPPDLGDLWFDEIRRLGLEPEDVPVGSDLRSDRWWRTPRARLDLPEK